MLKKLINKIIMGTKTYTYLKDKYIGLEDEKVRLEKILAKERIKFVDENSTNLSIIEKNKTVARKIIRVVNALIKKEDSVQAIKDIKVLCNQIIKGE